MSRFKVGDKVEIREDLENGREYRGVHFAYGMRKFRGKTVTIKVECDEVYFMEEDDRGWAFTEDMFVEGQPPCKYCDMELGEKYRTKYEDDRKSVIEYVKHMDKWYLQTQYPNDDFVGGLCLTEIKECPYCGRKLNQEEMFEMRNKKDIKVTIPQNMAEKAGIENEFAIEIIGGTMGVLIKPSAKSLPEKIGSGEMYGKIKFLGYETGRGIIEVATSTDKKCILFINKDKLIKDAIKISDNFPNEEMDIYYDIYLTKDRNEDGVNKVEFVLSEGNFK